MTIWTIPGPLAIIAAYYPLDDVPEIDDVAEKKEGDKEQRTGKNVLDEISLLATSKTDFKRFYTQLSSSYKLRKITQEIEGFKLPDGSNISVEVSNLIKNLQLMREQNVFPQIQLEHLAQYSLPLTESDRFPLLGVLSSSARCLLHHVTSYQYMKESMDLWRLASTNIEKTDPRIRVFFNQVDQKTKYKVDERAVYEASMLKKMLRIKAMEHKIDDAILQDVAEPFQYSCWTTMCIAISKVFLCTCSGCCCSSCKYRSAQVAPQ